MRISSNSFVYFPWKKIWTTIHSYILIPIHSYIFQKKIWTPIHSYISQFIRMSSDFKALILQY